jgi:hypothetical protein
MNIRFTSFAVIAALTVLAGCSQFTTSKKELAGMDNAANLKADLYVECLKREASTFTGSTDAAFMLDAAQRRCDSEMDAYVAAQSAFLSSQFMMIDKELAKSVDSLNEQSRAEIAEMLLTQPAPASAAVVSLAPAATAAAVVVTPSAWNADQRIYLDCMQDQAQKYAGLSESAAAIADVAASRCRSYLTEDSRQALETEGRAQVIGNVMDQRLQMPRE